jgi:hypothetical protein
MAGHGHIDAHGDKKIALLIAILALFLAVVETGAKSAQTEAISRNVEAANLWAFFQARTGRQTTVRTAAEQVELQKPAADAAVRAAIEAQQKAWRDTAARWEDDAQGGEGRKQLSERARAAEHRRDHAMAKYHLYEYSAAAFQVAIVVASSSIVVGVPMLAGGGILVALVGVALGLLGAFAPELLHI